MASRSFRFRAAIRMAPVLLLLQISLAAGEGKYDYSSIREEYSEAVCLLERADQGGGPRDEASRCLLDRPVDLREAIGIAIQNNPDSQMAMTRIRQTEAALEMSRAAFYPALGIYTEYLQGDAPSAYLFKTIDQRSLPPGTDFNDPGWFRNMETGLVGKINLFNGGRDWLQNRMAATQVTISRLDRLAVENSLAAAVISAYYDYLAAQDFIKIAEESVATVQSQLDIMTARYRAGGALKSDILSLEVRLARAREEVLISRNRSQMAMAALSNLLGLRPDREIRFHKSTLGNIAVPEDYASGVVQALENRPELKKVREQLSQSRMAVDLARAEYLPTLDLQGKYYHDDPDFAYDQDRQNWTVGMVLNWYFFTGLSTRAAHRQSSARLEEILAGDRKNVLSIQLDVKNAYLKLEEARARLTVAEKSVVSAEESLALVKVQFEGGSATITRYLEAELARNSARISSTTAFFDREKALADIGRAVGLLGPMFRHDREGG
ncbi:MAG: TolC family protein [Thermodesulfobacteriota bacterium]